MKLRQALAILLATAGTAVAQTGEMLSSPRIGWTTSDDGRELRALLGVPGSGRVSARFSLPEGISRVFLPPGQQYAVGYAEATGNWWLISLRDESMAAVKAIDGLHGPAGLLAFGPEGRTAVVTDAANAMARVVTLSADGVDVLWNVGVGQVSRIAVDSSGDLLLAAGAGGISVYRRGGESVAVAAAKDVTAIVFKPGGDAAAVADAGQRVVLIAERLISEPATQVLVSGEMGSPGALAWSRSGQFLWVADTEADAVTRIEVATAATQRFATDIRVDGFHRLTGNDHFLISSPAAGRAAWMLLAGPDGAGTYFVPGDPEDVQSAGEGAQQGAQQ
ncbi:MAG: hypothetical protein IT168_27020 [Bryobacterales bacterium]|nr:hypothetical protein [Bryobacterales bacterium]